MKLWHLVRIVHEYNGVDLYSATRAHVVAAPSSQRLSTGPLYKSRGTAARAPSSLAARTTCVELTADGPEEVICSDTFTG